MAKSNAETLAALGMTPRAVQALRATSLQNYEIAAHFGCSQRQLFRFAKSHRLPPRARNLRLSYDPERLADLWCGGTSQQKIADEFGWSIKQVRGAAGRLGLGRHGTKRPAWWSPNNRAPQSPPIEAKTPEQHLEAIPPHPFWSMDRNLRILATGGRYDDLCRAAKEVGKSMREVIQRWHKLRVMG